ncbi:MAG: HAMP domain-containing protein [Anaerolineae bacterium]|nr:HAMP domain-containing protein [Anaerolineae bacterium]
MSEKKQIRQRRISLRMKLLAGFAVGFVIFTLVFSLVSMAAYSWFNQLSTNVYQLSTDMALARIEEDLRITLRGAIEGVDGDEFEALVKEGVPDETGVPSTDPRYIQHQEWLMTVHQIEPRAFNTYTFVKGEGEREVLWIGDNYRVIRQDVATVFKEPYEVGLDSVLLNGLTEETVNMNYYTDDWGTWVSAYGPIRNSRGEIVGGLGMDMKADYVKDVQEAVRSQVQEEIQRRGVVVFGGTFAVLFVTYAASSVLVFMVSNRITRPVIALTAIAERVAEGDYEQDLSGHYSGGYPDEVSTLAQVFDLMIDKVHAREEHLKRQVQELRIEIDQSKKERHVQEIVESDYFKELRATAREMRRRAREEDENNA